MCVCVRLFCLDVRTLRDLEVTILCKKGCLGFFSSFRTDFLIAEAESIHTVLIPNL